MAERATLVFRQRYIYADRSIREMVLWKLSRRTRQRSHGFKYRLYYGTPDGRCLIRYDNETGKGDHRHLEEREERYHFSSVAALVADFMAEIDRLRSVSK
jgi:ribosomal protein L34